MFERVGASSSTHSAAHVGAQVLHGRLVSHKRDVGDGTAELKVMTLYELRLHIKR